MKDSNQPAPGPPLLTKRQVAARLQFTERHVDNLVIRGLLPVVKFSPLGVCRYRPEALEALIRGSEKP